MKLRPTFFFLFALIGSEHAAAQQVEAAKLFPPREYQSYATFVGKSVAISGKWALVGDHAGGSGGQAHFFRRDSCGWSFRQIMRESRNSSFGIAVAIDEDSAVIGANIWDWPNTTRGKAYAYSLQNGQWARTQDLLPSKLNKYAGFGASVAMSGNVLVVGAPAQNVVIPLGGEVFIYERTAGVWTLVKRFRLPPVPKTLSGDYRRLGAAVAVDGNVVVAGAPGATGGAFVYERDSTGWARKAVLEDPTPLKGDDFGLSVAVSGTTIVVGEPVYNGSLGSYRPGSAFIYERDASGTWGLDKEIRPTDGFATSNQGDKFGAGVSIDGGRIFVGMPSGKITGPNTGTCYLFAKGPNVWPKTETQRMVVDKPWGTSDSLGGSVGISGGFMIGGAIGAHVGPKRTGAAYVFEVELGQVFCPNPANSTGSPARLTATGSSRVTDQNLTLSVRQCPKNRLGAFFMSSSRTQQPLGDGLLCLGTPLQRLLPAVVTGPGGHAIYDLDFGDPTVSGSLTAGSTWCFQFWYSDPTGGPAGSNLSNAIALTLE